MRARVWNVTHLQAELMQRFFDENVLDLLLMCAQYSDAPPFDEDGLLLLEIFDELFRGIDPYHLVQKRWTRKRARDAHGNGNGIDNDGDAPPSSDAVRSGETETNRVHSAVLERIQFTQKNGGAVSSAPLRHSRFSGVYTKKFGDGGRSIARRDHTRPMPPARVLKPKSYPKKKNIDLTKVDADEPDEILLLQSKKNQRLGEGPIASSRNLSSSIELNPEFAEKLHEYVTTFVRDVFNIMLPPLIEDDLRELPGVFEDRGGQSHLRLMRLLTFLLSFFRYERIEQIIYKDTEVPSLAYASIGRCVTLKSIQYTLRLWHHCAEVPPSQDEKDWPLQEESMGVLSNILLILKQVAIDGDESDKRVVEVWEHQLLYDMTEAGLLPLIHVGLKRFDRNNQTRKSLVDLLVARQVALNLLQDLNDAASNAYGGLQVLQKKRNIKRRTKTKKTAEEAKAEAIIAKAAAGDATAAVSDAAPADETRNAAVLEMDAGTLPLAASASPVADGDAFVGVTAADGTDGDKGAAMLEGKKVMTLKGVDGEDVASEAAAAAADARAATDQAQHTDALNAVADASVPEAAEDAQQQQQQAPEKNSLASEDAATVEAAQEANVPIITNDDDVGGGDATVTLAPASKVGVDGIGSDGEANRDEKNQIEKEVAEVAEVAKEDEQPKGAEEDEEEIEDDEADDARKPKIVERVLDIRKEKIRMLDASVVSHLAWILRGFRNNPPLLNEYIIDALRQIIDPAPKGLGLAPMTWQLSLLHTCYDIMTDRLLRTRKSASDHKLMRLAMKITTSFFAHLMPERAGGENGRTDANAPAAADGGSEDQDLATNVDDDDYMMRKAGAGKLMFLEVLFWKNRRRADDILAQVKPPQRSRNAGRGGSAGGTNVASLGDDDADFDDIVRAARGEDGVTVAPQKKGRGLLTVEEEFTLCQLYDDCIDAADPVSEILAGMEHRFTIQQLRRQLKRLGKDISALRKRKRGAILGASTQRIDDSSSDDDDFDRNDEDAERAGAGLVDGMDMDDDPDGDDAAMSDGAVSPDEHTKKATVSVSADGDDNEEEIALDAPVGVDGGGGSDMLDKDLRVDPDADTHVHVAGTITADKENVEGTYSGDRVDAAAPIRRTSTTVKRRFVRRKRRFLDDTINQVADPVDNALVDTDANDTLADFDDDDDEKSAQPITPSPATTKLGAAAAPGGGGPPALSQRAMRVIDSDSE